jgi:hypothetical protein
MYLILDFGESVRAVVGVGAGGVRRSAGVKAVAIVAVGIDTNGGD